VTDLDAQQLIVDGLRARTLGDLLSRWRTALDAVALVHWVVDVAPAASGEDPPSRAGETLYGIEAASYADVPTPVSAPCEIPIELEGWSIQRDQPSDGWLAAEMPAELRHLAGLRRFVCATKSGLLAAYFPSADVSDADETLAAVVRALASAFTQLQFVQIVLSQRQLHTKLDGTGADIARSQATEDVDALLRALRAALAATYAEIWFADEDRVLAANGRRPTANELEIQRLVAELSVRAAADNEAHFDDRKGPRADILGDGKDRHVGVMIAPVADTGIFIRFVGRSVAPFVYAMDEWTTIRPALTALGRSVDSELAQEAQRVAADVWAHMSTSLGRLGDELDALTSRGRALDGDSLRRALTRSDPSFGPVGEVSIWRIEGSRSSGIAGLVYTSAGFDQRQFSGSIYLDEPTLAFVRRAIEANEPVSGTDGDEIDFGVERAGRFDLMALTMARAPQDLDNPLIVVLHLTGGRLLEDSVRYSMLRLFTGDVKYLLQTGESAREAQAQRLVAEERTRRLQETLKILHHQISQDIRYMGIADGRLLERYEDQLLTINVRTWPHLRLLRARSRRLEVRVDAIELYSQISARRIDEDREHMEPYELLKDVQRHTTVHLDHVCRELVTVYRDLAYESRGPDFSIADLLDPALEGVHVVMSDRALEEAMTCLLDNASKYASRKSTVTVTLSLGRSSTTGEVVVLVEVANRPGVRLDPEDLDRCFDYEWRGRWPARNIAGRGLGLYLARELLRLSSGDLTARVEHDDRGGEQTLFTIELPLARS